jgi:hypothetical protein
MAHVYCPDISNAQLPNPGYIERAAASYAYAYGVSVVVRLPRANHDYEATFSNRPQSVIRWDLACRRLSPRGVPLYDTVSSDRQLVILFYTTDYFAEEHLSDIGRNPKTLKIFERLVQNSSN